MPKGTVGLWDYDKHICTEALAALTITSENVDECYSCSCA
jgi:hypothetical protein